MAGVQSTILGMGGAIAGAALKMGKTASSKDVKGPEETKISESASGIDAQMAAKAREEVNKKIQAIYANKALSKKAKERKMGKAVNQYIREQSVNPTGLGYDNSKHEI